ncbi:MAG: DUF1893 domain-containing protein [Candidatus Bathyarchaeia archaeon]|nr:DUF1893 domain-containing protein [Candidatus Bathyarchaeota archaeon]
MSWFVEELERRKLSVLIYGGGEAIYSSSEKGVIPLLKAIDLLGLEGLRGSIVADKVIGKAAALLIMYFKASEAHAALISSSAKELFLKRGLKHSYRRETPNILNRDGSDICPFEKLVANIAEPEEAYRRIREKASQPY